MPISASTPALFRHDAQQRALIACVGVSIGLHTLVLVSFPGFRSSSVAVNSPVLTARFAFQPAPEIPKPASTRAEPQSRKPETPPPVLATPAPELAPQKAEAAPEPPSPAQSAPVELARAAQSPIQPAQAGAFSRSPNEPADDAAMRRQYLIGLVRAARLYMRYPAQARERGWEGRVEVRLVIGTSGTIKSAVIKSSSRYQILDDQALDMVRKSQRRLEIPPALRGREFSVDIPVTFELLTG